MKASLSTLLASLLIAACATTNVPVRYYAMTAETQAAPATAVPRLSLAIANVSLPESVDRAAIVLRSSPTRIEILENDRWADGLRREIPRLLAAHLNATKTGIAVSFYPQAAADLADYTLDLDVMRFDATRGKEVALELRWTLRRARGDAASFPPRSGTIVLSEPVSGNSVDAIVEAASRALKRVAGELSGLVISLPDK